jgi:hypothetical protein
MHVVILICSVILLHLAMVLMPAIANGQDRYADPITQSPLFLNALVSNPPSLTKDLAINPANWVSARLSGDLADDVARRVSTPLTADLLLDQSDQVLALYQTGKTHEALHTLYGLVRQYPKFADFRAALTVILWVEGNRGEADSEWVSAIALDSRYKNLEWLRTSRCWPPRMIEAMEKFLDRSA